MSASEVCVMAPKKAKKTIRTTIARNTVTYHWKMINFLCRGFVSNLNHGCPLPANGHVSWMIPTIRIESPEIALSHSTIKLIMTSGKNGDVYFSVWRNRYEDIHINIRLTISDKLLAEVNIGSKATPWFKSNLSMGQIRFHTLMAGFLFDIYMDIEGRRSSHYSVSLNLMYM
ncbi:hypothetical protein HDE_00306 [Halotydeus destructor]|nr:hypothetical protein HDE_00306 [Halotydeus destructor]